MENQINGTRMRLVRLDSPTIILCFDHPGKSSLNLADFLQQSLNASTEDNGLQNLLCSQLYGPEFAKRHKFSVYGWGP